MPEVTTAGGRSNRVAVFLESSSISYVSSGTSALLSVPSSTRSSVNKLEQYPYIHRRFVYRSPIGRSGIQFTHPFWWCNASRSPIQLRRFYSKWKFMLAVRSLDLNCASNYVIVVANVLWIAFRNVLTSTRTGVFSCIAVRQPAEMCRLL